MKTERLIILTLSLLTTLFGACGDVPVIDIQAPKGDTLKENLINANRYIAQSEETQIDAYVARRGWQMQRLPAGVRVMTVREGRGRRVDYEDTVSIRYRLEAINGAVVYDNVSETVVVGRMQPTRGLDAALRTLREGSTARVILPSEQAYGVPGDGNRVKSRMVLIYEVEVMKINNKKVL